MYGLKFNWLTGDKNDFVVVTERSLTVSCLMTMHDHNHIYSRKHEFLMEERKALNAGHEYLYKLLEGDLDSKYRLLAIQNDLMKEIDEMNLERMFREDEKALSMTEGTVLMAKNESESEKSALGTEKVLLMANATGSEAEQMRTAIYHFKDHITYLKDKINQLELKVKPSC